MIAIKTCRTNFSLFSFIEEYYWENSTIFICSAIVSILQCVSFVVSLNRIFVLIPLTRLRVCKNFVWMSFSDSNGFQKGFAVQRGLPVLFPLKPTGNNAQIDQMQKANNL